MCFYFLLTVVTAVSNHVVSFLTLHLLLYPPLILHSQAPQPVPNPPRSCTKHKMVLYIRLKRN